MGWCMRKAGVKAGMLLAASSWSTVAAAQEVTSSTATGEGLEEIVVTAERRETNIQDTPLSIQAMSGELLDEAGVKSTLDLQFVSPGLLVSTNTASAQIFIRGVGSNFGGGQSVAVHVDGIYQVTAATALQDFLDVERVEVLKGPQGTLYGRNATAGVVNIISKRPTQRLEAEAVLDIGNYDRFRTSATVNVPLVTDRLAARFSVLSSDRDGYRKNPYLNTRLDNEDSWAARAQFLFTPTDNIEVLLAGNYSEEEDSRTLGFKINPGVFAPQVDLLPEFGLPGGTVPEDPDIILSNKDSFQDYKQYGLRAQVDADLGSVSFRSISGYQRNTRKQNIDVDGTEVDYFNSISDGDITQWYSQELQLYSNNGAKLEWITGLFGLRDERKDRVYFTTPIFDQLGQSNGPIYSDMDSVTTALGAYAQATYRLTERINLTAGLRYSWEKKKSTSFVGGQATNAALEPVRAKWDALTPKAAIEFHPNDDVMFYASATKGFKSGGIDEDGSEIYDPEYIWSYETGLRSTWFDRRVRFNATGFYYDYSNIQIIQALAEPDPVTGATQRVGNAAAATVKGLELELAVLPLPGLQLTANGSFLWSRYDRYLTPNSEAPGSPVVDLSGNRLPKAPKFAGSFVARYTWDVADHGSAYVQGDVYRQSKIYFSSYNALNDQFDQERPYTTLGASLGFEAADGRWRASIYGRNLTNEVYRHTVIRAVGFFGQLDILAPPRTYGVEIGFRF